MAEFPFEIAKLSRFETSAEQKETVRRLANGQVDIVIGTHRLASADVQFFNLGLLIIDEEQKFGVEAQRTHQEDGIDGRHPDAFRDANSENVAHVAAGSSRYFEFGRRRLRNAWRSKRESFDLTMLWCGMRSCES